jgi:hypothetical protein
MQSKSPIGPGQHLEGGTPNAPCQPDKDPYCYQRDGPVNRQQWYGPTQQGRENSGKQCDKYSSQEHIKP